MGMYVILGVWTLSQWIAHPSLWSGLLLGIAMAMIGLNVQHEANHGALWTYPFLQWMLGFALDVVGGSKYLWMQQHWSHHAHTNSAQDCDAFSALPFLMLQPPHGDKGTSPKFFHAWQHWIALPLFTVYWLSTQLSSMWITHRRCVPPLVRSQFLNRLHLFVLWIAESTIYSYWYFIS